MSKENTEEQPTENGSRSRENNEAVSELSTNDNSQTKSMEVHHHQGQHRKKKRFKEYFLQ